ncbi:MAG: pyridoxal-phosphate dependent enzyme [Microthrixaceae bacterium]|nr:pyridoxal-phosphate dependent enzyme [Microthrixaceae bacterium]
MFLYQYGNEANPRAHYMTTGPEIWRDVPDITHFVAGLGTSGTLLGVGTFLKEQNPEVKVLAVEPPSGEQVEGLRSLDDGYIPPVFEKWGGYDVLDGKSIVRPRESLEHTRMLAEVGIFSGISAGAALAGSAQGGRTHRLGCGRVRDQRLRLEVPVDRCLDPRPGRSGAQRREGDLLLRGQP